MYTKAEAEEKDIEAVAAELDVIHGLMSDDEMLSLPIEQRNRSKRDEKRSGEDKEGKYLA